MSLQTSQATDLSQGDKQGPSDQKRKKVHKRTRTGCTTCRARKMKCDEVKPICGNCSKSRRDCRWHDLTFRHDQNASVNESKNSQSKFYRGSGTFTPEQRRSFVPVSNDIQFTPTLSATAPLNMQPRPTRTPIEDRHLQALAATAAAAQYPQYTPPQGSYPTYTEAAQATQTAQMAQFTPNNPNISALLNPTRTPTSMIDPSLETPAGQTNISAEDEARDGETSGDVEDNTKTEEEEINETDTKLAHALQGFSDGKGKESDNAEGPG